MLSMASGCQVRMSGRCKAYGNAARGSLLDIRNEGSSVEIVGELCASNNIARGAASFANILLGGSLRVADNASVLVDGSDPGVFVSDGVAAAPPVGLLYCGSDPSTASCQPGSYSITGDLCSAAFETGGSTTCDSCEGVCFNPWLCECKVRVKALGVAWRLGLGYSTTTEPQHRLRKAARALRLASTLSEGCSSGGHTQANTLPRLQGL